MDGYKCFNSNFTNNSNELIKPNTTYVLQDKLKIKKNGFHFCKRLEDTLRYFDGLKEDIIICKVKALGDIIWYEDNYYDYYDIGCTNKIYISNPLSREEIMSYADNLIDTRFIRFIQEYKLTKEEKEYFKNKYINNRLVINYLKYYQEDDLEVFEREYNNRKSRLRILK